MTEAQPAPTRKWLGPFGGLIIFGIMILVWLLHLLFDQFVVGQLALTPNTLVLGGFAVASGFIYTMAYRLRPDDGITPLRLLLAFLLGGLAATELAFVVEDIVIHLPVGSRENQSILTSSLAGVVEEACKLLAVIVVARGLQVRTARSGLFLGGAVGFGFASFEDMRYAFSGFNPLLTDHSQLGSVLSLSLLRDAFGPFEHPIMSALIAAAFFAGTKNGRFRITPIFIGVYLVIAAVHGLIDTLPLLVQAAIGPNFVSQILGLLIAGVFCIGLGVAWLVYTRHLRTLATAPELVSPPVPLD